MKGQDALQVIRFYKPFGVLSKFTDTEGRPTLADYIDIPDIYAAGRLDFDSEGLLILTNDGALNTQLTDPRHAHPRSYLVQVERIPDANALDALRAGVIIQGQKTRPAEVELYTEAPELPPRNPPIRFRKSIPTAFIKLTLREGKNRQVRRMTATVGHPALRLIRVSSGPITLTGLAPGEWQALTQDELDALRRSLRQKR